MSKTGRNSPCPCGSGRKYKRCCLASDQRAATERREQQRDAAIERQMYAASVTAPPVYLDEDPLDELSNSVVYLIRQQRFDEALAACQRLLDEYPEVIDGLERSAMVHAAKGDHAAAADFYRRCLAFVDEHPGHFSAEAVDEYRKELDRMEQLAGTA